MILGDLTQIPELVSGPTGPHRDGYLQCEVIYPNGETRLTNYHRFIFEENYGRLPKNIEVHHIDENKLNNSLSNLESKEKSIHMRDHLNKRQFSREMIEVNCIHCDKLLLRKAKIERSNIRRGINGPFCSHKCSALYYRLGR